jgi:trans-2,3-dihydro-3-hydroxyanthranilate isomerase
MGKISIKMFQRKPKFGDLHHPEEVLSLFGLDEEDLFPGAPIQTVSTGTPMLMVMVRGHEQLRKIHIDADRFKRYREKMNFFSPHFFCLQGISPDAQTFARHLDIPPDATEDAFTGSATGSMAAYLWKYQLITKPQFIAEQGHWMGRPGSAHVEVLGSPEDIESVTIAGEAVTTVRGELFL